MRDFLLNLFKTKRFKASRIIWCIVIIEIIFNLAIIRIAFIQNAPTREQSTTIESDPFGNEMDNNTIIQSESLPMKSNINMQQTAKDHLLKAIQVSSATSKNHLTGTNSRNVRDDERIKNANQTRAKLTSWNTSSNSTEEEGSPFEIKACNISMIFDNLSAISNELKSPTFGGVHQVLHQAGLNISILKQTVSEEIRFMLSH